MKQFLKGLGLTAIIFGITTFTSHAHAAFITIDYNGKFNEKREAPADPEGAFGDFDNFGFKPGSAAFKLIGDADGFRNTFYGSLNPLSDYRDQFNIVLAKDQTLTEASFFFDTELELSSFDRDRPALEWTWSLENNSTGYDVFNVDVSERDTNSPNLPLVGMGSYLVTIGLPDYNDEALGRSFDYVMTYTVETISLSVVPLPAAFPLYGAGIALLGFMGWKRKRKLV